MGAEEYHKQALPIGIFEVLVTPTHRWMSDIAVLILLQGHTSPSYYLVESSRRRLLYSDSAKNGIAWDF